ncbi:hypothetical protein C8R47DRAFT_1207276 [Mycena vitilis]|nr:hypothetical protein C8R47DRAFT_1207276 [Mycena vitilis]
MPLTGVSLVVHIHIGFDSMVVDYLHVRKFPVIERITACAPRPLAWSTSSTRMISVGAHLRDSTLAFHSH